LLADAGMRKLNISGGEPFLKPNFIGEIFRFCKEELRLESCSVVNNGSKVTEKWLDHYGDYLDLMAISCDSFDPEVNISLGRAENGTAEHIGRVFQVAEWCRKRGIKVKINSVITRYCYGVWVPSFPDRLFVHSLNWEEDMNASIEELAPARWKV
jgi:radical S-adenosyl methionine domain-containing protein 2